MNAVLRITCREAHDVEDAVQLVVVVRVTRLNVLLPTVEYRLRGQELCKDAADRPNIWKRATESVRRNERKWVGEYKRIIRFNKIDMYMVQYADMGHFGWQNINY